MTVGTKRCAFLLVLLGWVSAAPVSADSGLPTAKPEAVGMSSERLARVGPALQAYIDRSEVAGTVTMVARRGKVVYQEARGWSDIEADKPLRTDSARATSGYPPRGRSPSATC